MAGDNMKPLTFTSYLVSTRAVTVDWTTRSEIRTEHKGENMKERMKKLKMKIQKLVYWIKRKIYYLRYRRLTYIPEKGVWVSTVVFPGKVTEDGVCGVTDVFVGNEKKVDFSEVLHSIYIRNASESGNIHRDMVKCVKGGYTIENC